MYLNEKYTKTVRIMFINTIKNFFFIDFIVLYHYFLIMQSFFITFVEKFGVPSSENDVFGFYNKIKTRYFFMMISPQEFENDLKNESLKNLIKMKNSLIQEIKYFEKNKDVILAQEVTICPSEEVVYKMNLLYLDVCNKLIAEKCK